MNFFISFYIQIRITWKIKNPFSSECEKVLFAYLVACTLMVGYVQKYLVFYLIR